MRVLNISILIMAVFAFVACGQNSKISSKSRSLLIAKGASPISAPGDMVGRYDSEGQADAYDMIVISSSGAVKLEKDNKITNELLGKDNQGRYLITDTAKSATYYLTYTGGYKLEIVRTDNVGYIESYYKVD